MLQRIAGAGALALTRRPRPDALVGAHVSAAALRARVGSSYTLPPSATSRGESSSSLPSFRYRIESLPISAAASLSATSTPLATARGADASLVALAERLDAPIVITLDRRHFAAIKPRHGEAFEVTP
jgi:hypothetical protein